MSRLDTLRYLLLQMRNPDDPMRSQEVDCFASVLGTEAYRIATGDLLAGFPSPRELAEYDVVLFGGSGDYSAAGQGAWLDRILDGMRELAAESKPTFASCWGFQALSRALGGECVHDHEHAELGSAPMTLTAEGESDPVFGALPQRFLALCGHEDRVSRLPKGAVLLASSNLVEQQAYVLAGKPVYATQFHPELTKESFMQRVRAYPRYVEQISGQPVDTFERELEETPPANGLLRAFVEVTFGS
ncbi:MAG: gamma-glutamyl-gamma-aminobutyrate hydrolase family protein [Planctomycetales bacterium]|nr:gamma-glutamyl-gamma-aminobutyrate hydrolase family protein [Planctomycetales bacterium]